MSATKIESIGVLGRDKEPGFLMFDGLYEAASLESHDGNAGRGRFQSGNAETLGQRGMGEQIEAGDKRIQIVAETGEPHDPTKPEARRLRSQLVVQVSVAENDELQRRIAVLEVGHGLQQVLVAFARDQLPGCGQRKVALEVLFQEEDYSDVIREALFLILLGFQNG